MPFLVGDEALDSRPMEGERNIRASTEEAADVSPMGHAVVHTRTYTSSYIFA
jgi:hypothetical protein